MKPTDLLKVLDEAFGEEAIELIVPYPFLPPRFQGQSAGRNMRLLLTEEATIQVLWEGSQLSDCVSLSSGEACRLLKDVARTMVAYHADLERLDLFLAECKLPRTLHPSIVEPEQKAGEALAEKGTEEDATPPSPAEENLATTATLGGESPLPDWDY